MLPVIRVFFSHTQPMFCSHGVVDFSFALSYMYLSLLLLKKVYFFFACIWNLFAYKLYCCSLVMCCQSFIRNSSRMRHLSEMWDFCDGGCLPHPLQYLAWSWKNHGWMVLSKTFFFFLSYGYLLNFLLFVAALAGRLYLGSSCTRCRHSLFGVQVKDSMKSTRKCLVIEFVINT